MITGVDQTSGTTTVITGILNAATGTGYKIYAYSSQSCDPSLSGEGQTFRGATSITTDVSGNGVFSISASGTTPSTHAITVLATHGGTGSSSEFSVCWIVP